MLNPPGLSGEPMTVKFAISAQTVKMDEATFTQDWPENN